MTTRKSTGIKKHTFRTAYNPGDNKIYQTAATDGITEQHHSESCDINKILNTFMQTGIMPPTNLNPQYGDASNPQMQFNEAMNQIAQAKSLFEQLPENVKIKFDNEPYKFLQFAEDENNHAAMIEMGLINAPASLLVDEALPIPDAAPVEQVIRDDTVAT
jgi:phage internal scaffolding protein